MTYCARVHALRDGGELRVVVRSEPNLEPSAVALVHVHVDSLAQRPGLCLLSDWLVASSEASGQ